MKRTRQTSSSSLMLCFVGDYQFAVETSSIERITDRAGMDEGRVIELAALLGLGPLDCRRLLVVRTAAGRVGFAVESISKGDLSSLPVHPVPPCVTGCMNPNVLRGFVNVEDLLLQVLDLAALADWVPADPDVAKNPEDSRSRQDPGSPEAGRKAP